METAIKNIRSRKKFTRGMLMGFRVLFVAFLAITLTFASPIYINKAWAAPKEDCDCDGYDDATGVAVPWPCYDETKGDTPEGPGGGSTATTKKSTTPTKKSTTPTKKSTTPTKKSTTPTNKSTTPTKPNTTTPTKPNTITPTKPNTITPTKPGDSSPGTTGSPQDETTSASPDSSKSGKKSTTNKKTTKKGTDSTATDGNNTDGQQVETAAALDIETIVNAKGTLEINEVNGSIVHAGSTIVISGVGFAGNVEDLEIEIHSIPQHLYTVTSNEDGSFEATVNIPDDLDANTHDIVVLYQGREISRQSIEVGPKAANSFGKALMVGFTGDNNELAAGLTILAILLALGGLALLFNVFVQPRLRTRTE